MKISRRWMWIGGAAIVLVLLAVGCVAVVLANRPLGPKLNIFAADAVKKRKAPDLWQQFIKRNVDWAIKDKDSFQIGFVNHFECLVGFYPETN